MQGELSAESNTKTAEPWELPPIPESEVPDEAFPAREPQYVGHISFAEGDIAINETRDCDGIIVTNTTNTGDRPVQVGPTIIFPRLIRR